ncbi:MAG: hypothetical protein AB9842_06065 [Bacteroidales bacterium]
MKKIIIFAATMMNLAAYAQDKCNYVHFNKLTEVEGTEYVIASVENRGKTLETKSQYLLFVNTKSGERNQVDFPDDAMLGKPEQIKIDSLGINVIFVAARTIDLDGKSGIDWNDPTQIIMLSTDGKQKTQMTGKHFFARTWTVNRYTGTMVVTGHNDTNNNNKYDKTDKSEVHIYDLKSLNQVQQF